jgi:uncharacterized protein DUF3306
MSDEDFLARWSRLKQRAEGDQPLPEPEKGAAPSLVEAAEETAKPEIDLASLPSLDSIDATTDITAFLRKGIPPELSRAALRRAWSSDPTIRDFVGPAENAWDFNDPYAMPGFGPLDWSAEQVEALVRRLFGGVTQAGETVLDPPLEIADRTGSADTVADSPQAPGSLKESAGFGPLGATTNTEPQQPTAAPQPEVGAPADGEEASAQRRTHGGALPH